jgi:hypothetical protein
MRSTSSLTFVALLLAANAVFAETVTVEPGQSLQEAADKLQPGDTLLLAEGTYYQSFELNTSGTAERPITIKAAVPGKVIITGAMENTPTFERVEGNIYKTRWVPARKWSGSGTRQLWVVADQRNLYNYNSMEEDLSIRQRERHDPAGRLLLPGRAALPAPSRRRRPQQGEGRRQPAGHDDFARYQGPTPCRRGRAAISRGARRRPPRRGSSSRGQQTRRDSGLRVLRILPRHRGSERARESSGGSCGVRSGRRHGRTLPVQQLPDLRLGVLFDDSGATVLARDV